MAVFRGVLAKHLTPGFARIVMNEYKKRPIEGTALVNQKTSNRAYEEDFAVAGLGPLVLKPEGTPALMATPLEGPVKRYTWSTFARGFRITMEMMDDNLYGNIGSKLSAQLGYSARLNKEIVMHSILNNAFNPAFYGWEAGVPLCATNHVVLKTGQTIANTPATPADLSLPALQAALEHFHTLVDPTGFPVVYVPRLLVHGIGDYWVVKQILRSEKLPGTNFNDVNPVTGEGLTPHLSHYLVDPDAWFVICDNHDMNYYLRRDFVFRSTDDVLTGDMVFVGWQRHGAGFSDWRGVYGSPGA